MSRLASLLLLAVAVAASGCVTAQAKGEPGGPALAPPDPPPHTVIPVQIVEAQPARQEPEGPTAGTAVKGAAAAQPARPAAPQPEKATPEAPPVQPAAPPAPPLQIRSNVAAEENEILKLIKQAEDNLDKGVNPETLKNSDRNLQFETAKRFLREAKEALKVKNLVFAKELAGKAATLAAALSKK